VLSDGPVSGFKRHALWGFDYVPQAAHVPAWEDNLAYYTTPGSLLSYRVEARATTLANPWIVDRLPADVQLLAIIDVDVSNIGRPDPSTYAFFISTEETCSPAAGTSWIAVDPLDFAALAPARCLKVQFTGLFQDRTAIVYNARLRDQPRDYLLAQPDRYQVLNNVAWFGADNSSGVEGGPAWAGDPLVREYVDQSTVWNTNVARAYTQPTEWGYPHAGVGSSVLSVGSVPFDRRTAAGTSFTDLTFRQTLPLELDLEGPPRLAAGRGAPLDANGQPWLPTCEWHPQDQTQLPHVAAWWQCTFPGAYPGLLHDPLNTPGCDLSNYFCFNDFENRTPQGEPIFNNYFFAVPEKVLAGTQGQVIYQSVEAWSSVPPGPSGQAQPSSSRETAFSATGNSLTINGIQQMNMTNVAAGAQLPPGGTMAFDVRYANSGSAGVSGTAIYDLLGRDPTTGAPLPGCQIPALASPVANLGGLPAPIVEYTTDSPPVPSDSGNWSASAPANLASVTGVRIVPVSFFTGTRGAFGPTDPPGHVQITLRDTAGAGSKLCNAAAITGTGFAPAQSTAAPADVIDSCGQITYGPAANEHGLLLFEDLWPRLGDADFNDQTVAYNYQFLSNGSGVLALQLNINVLSIGGSIRNGLWLRLPIPAATPASIVRTDQAGAQVALTRAAGETELVVELIPDTRSLFAFQDQFINTVPTTPARTGKAFQVKITFAAPVSLDTGASPYDLFVAQSANGAHQIHLQEYAGTAAMDVGLFGTFDDRSSSSAHFIDAKGLPFALHVPASVAWARERIALDAAYPAITDWAMSGGATNADWFTHPVADVVFTSGNGVLAPAPVMVGPALTDPSCTH